MKIQSFNPLLFAALLATSSLATAGLGDEAYFAEMEKMAAQAEDTTATRDAKALQRDDMRIDVGAGLVEIKNASPTAFAVYKSLRPAYKAEIRKAIRNGQETYSVIELIFSRKNLMSNR